MQITGFRGASREAKGFPTCPSFFNQLFGRLINTYLMQILMKSLNEGIVRRMDKVD